MEGLIQVKGHGGGWPVLRQPLDLNQLRQPLDLNQLGQPRKHGPVSSLLGQPLKHVHVRCSWVVGLQCEVRKELDVRERVPCRRACVAQNTVNGNGGAW